MIHAFHPSRRFRLPYEPKAALKGGTQYRQPSTLFLTCADSLLDNSLIPRLQDSNVTLLRRPGNRVNLPADMEMGAVQLLERLVGGAGIKDIIICGHSQCSAVRSSTPEDSPAPAPESWYDRVVRRRVEAQASAERAKQNVLKQISVLHQSPQLSDAVAAGHLQIHGWFYFCESGTLVEYDCDVREFVQRGPHGVLDLPS